MKNQKGFTLVELLVVIAIIGILAAIAVPKFASATDTANVATFESHHKTIVGAIALSVANTGGVTPTVEQVNKNLPANLQVGTTGTSKDRPAGAVYDYVEATGVLTSTLLENKAAIAKFKDAKMVYSMANADETIYLNGKGASPTT